MGLFWFIAQTTSGTGGEAIPWYTTSEFRTAVGGVVIALIGAWALLRKRPDPPPPAPEVTAADGIAAGGNISAGRDISIGTPSAQASVDIHTHVGLDEKGAGEAIERAIAPLRQDIADLIEIVTTPAPKQKVLHGDGELRRKAKEIYNKGNDAWEEGKYADARAYFDAAIHLDKNLSAAHFNRGLIRAALGDKAGASADMNAAYPFDFGFSGAAYPYNICIRDSETLSDALVWLTRMRDDKVKPVVVTYNTLMNKSDDYQTAKGWYDVMKGEGIKPSVVT
ncbi:MAG: tetratricopeptide repeat protein, partial [Fimbriimonadaceae bacterium]